MAGQASEGDGTRSHWEDSSSLAKAEDYVFVDGKRFVRPYFFQFVAHVKERWHGKPIAELFAHEFRQRPYEYYVEALQRGRILVAGQRVEPGYRVKNSQQMTHFVHRHEPPVQAGPIEVLIETRHVIAVSKPGSMPVHPCGQYRKNTVLGVLQAQHDYGDLFPVHRLDKLVSGLLILARNAQSANAFRKEIEAGTVRKEYVAKVVGVFPEGQVEVTAPVTYDPRIGRSVAGPVGTSTEAPNIIRASGSKPVPEKRVEGRRGPKVRAVAPPGGGEGGRTRDACTRFERVSTDGTTSVVRCMPRTGRTHQIRVHLQHLGHPIANDTLYLSAAGSKISRRRSLPQPVVGAAAAGAASQEPGISEGATRAAGSLGGIETATKAAAHPGEGPGALTGGEEVNGVVPDRQLLRDGARHVATNGEPGPGPETPGSPGQSQEPVDVPATGAGGSVGGPGLNGRGGAGESSGAVCREAQRGSGPHLRLVADGSGDGPAREVPLAGGTGGVALERGTLSGPNATEAAEVPGPLVLGAAAIVRGHLERAGDGDTGAEPGAAEVPSHRALPASEEAGEAAPRLISAVRPPMPDTDAVAACSIGQQDLVGNCPAGRWGPDRPPPLRAAASKAGVQDEVDMGVNGLGGVATGERTAGQAGSSPVGHGDRDASAPAGGRAVSDANSQPEVVPPLPEALAAEAAAARRGGVASPGASCATGGAVLAPAAGFEVDALCTHCPNLGPQGFEEDEEEEEPLLFHCTRYSGEGWSYECPLPPWAR